MRTEELIQSLESFPVVLEPLVTSLDETQLRWRPPNNAWSVLEVVAHLADEEDDDFPARLRLILEDPKADWPPINPEVWARERSYNDADPSRTLARFKHARAEHIRWLRSIAPDWSQAHEHPRFGAMRAGDMLTAWAAHDMLHLRQIAKRRFQLIEAAAPEFETRYAGEWTT